MGGQWDYCEWCGAIGWVDYGHCRRLVHEHNECAWRNEPIGDDILENAAGEVAELNRLEAAAAAGPT